MSGTDPRDWSSADIDASERSGLKTMSQFHHAGPLGGVLESINTAYCRDNILRTQDEFCLRTDFGRAYAFGSSGWLFDLLEMYPPIRKPGMVPTERRWSASHIRIDEKWRVELARVLIDNFVEAKPDGFRKKRDNPRPICFYVDRSKDEDAHRVIFEEFGEFLFIAVMCRPGPAKPPEKRQ